MRTYLFRICYLRTTLIYVWITNKPCAREAEIMLLVSWIRRRGSEQFQTETKNGSSGDFPQSVYCLLIMQTEVCCLSVCFRKKRTKGTCPSMIKITNKSLCSKY